MLQKIVSIYKVKERYGKLLDSAEVIISATRKKPQCPYRLLNILFSDSFLKAWCNLGMWLIRLNFTQAKHPTINYFGKEFKNHL